MTTVKSGATTASDEVTLRLFVAFTSPTVCTVAALVIAPSALAATLAVSVMVTDWPAVIAGCAAGAGRTQVTISRVGPLRVPVTEQVNVAPASAPLTKVSPAGSVSVIVIAPVLPPSPAATGETFVSVSAKVVVAPTLIGPLPVLVIEKSGTDVTGSAAVVAVSLPGLKSPGVATEALFTTVGKAPNPTVARNGNCTTPPDAIGPALVHVTIWPAATHAKPPPPDPMFVYVSPAASESRTVMAPVVGPAETLLTLIVNVTVSFTMTEPVGDFESDRSGIDDTGTGPVWKVSLVGLASPGALTVTRLTLLGNAAAPTVTLSAKRVDVFAAIALAVVQVTTSRPLNVPVTKQLNAPVKLVTERYVSPVGNVSVTVIGPGWFPGETFCRVIVQLAGWPMTNAESDDLVMEMSGDAMTSAGLSLPKLLTAFTSPGVLTCTVLVTDGRAAGLTTTTRAMLALPAAAIGPALVHVTSCAAAEQLKPPPVPVLNASPVGRVSITVIAPVVAVDPTFCTRIV